jgi:hypothetical protein
VRLRAQNGAVDSRAEHVLAGGNVSGQVVRVGSTVRKPATPATPAIEALLHYLAGAGFDGSPPLIEGVEAGLVTAWNAPWPNCSH